MSGSSPFSANKDSRIRANIITCNYEFKDQEWEGVSSEAKKWISKLLDLDPKTRMTAKQAREDPWLKDMTRENQKKRFKFSPNVMMNIKSKNYTELHKLILPQFS